MNRGYKHLDTLTGREVDVLNELVNHLGNIPAISDALVMSPHTVKTHLHNIYQKLDVDCKVGAVIKAFRLGLIKLESLSTLPSSRRGG